MNTSITNASTSSIQRQPRQKFRGRVRTAWLDNHASSGTAADLDDRHHSVATRHPEQVLVLCFGNADDSNPPCSIISQCLAQHHRFTSLIAGRRPMASSCRRRSRCNCSNRSPHKASASRFSCSQRGHREHEQSADLFTSPRPWIMSVVQQSAAK